MSAMSAGPSPLIRLRGIEKIYGQGQAAFHALRGIDLDVDEGDFIAVMGRLCCTNPRADALTPTPDGLMPRHPPARSAAGRSD